MLSNDQGWYCTKDIVDKDKDGFIAITGRDSDVINVGGLKFMPSEVERECLKKEYIKFAKAIGVANPITGQYVELKIELSSDAIDARTAKEDLLAYLKLKLPKYMLPSKILFTKQTLSHRFKKL